MRVMERSEKSDFGSFEQFATLDVTHAKQPFGIVRIVY